MSSDNSMTWRPLLDDKKARFKECGIVIKSIPTEPDFVTKFEALCRKQRQMYYTRLLGGLKLNKISAFARAVDRGCGNALPDTVAALVYGATFVVVKRLWRAGSNPQELVKMLAELHTSFPPVDAASVRLLYEYEPLTSLHNLFEAYCDALLASMALVAHDGSQLERMDHLPQAREIIREKVKEIQGYSSLYLQALDLAAKKQQETKLLNGKVLQINGIKDSRARHDATAHYISIRHLGRGAFGDVDEVQAVSGGARYARKRINFYGDSAARGREKEVLDEIAIMERLRHPHIVEIRFWLQEDFVYSIFMKPVADCNLLSFLRECCRIDYPEGHIRRIYSWFGCLLDGLNFAHRRRIMHRDIKPANILVEGDQIRLADFGSAKDVSDQMATLSKDYFIYGTPVYRAPETQPGQPSEAPADIFSLGCVFAEMLTVANFRSLTDFQAWRQAPANECGPNAFRANLPKVKSWLTELDNDSLPRIASVQVLDMIKANPSHRATAKDGMKLLRSKEEFFFCEYH